MKSWRDGLPQIPFAYRALPQGGEWMTREAAASCLGGREFHVNLLMAGARRVDAVRTADGEPAVTRADGEPAVTRAGVEAEKHWRATAPRRRKLLRLLKDTALSF
ncbi:hypothetical protein [Kitasatospora griseola]|uniref:hypothetical protein n=1 Tax=Kitasatospora griseola TaxID=2064 RepID=UPI00380F10A5